MKSRRTKKFRKLYDRLQSETQELAEKSFALWIVDPNHTSLNFELIDPEDRIWSARVGIHYRALAAEEDGLYLWYWIGSKGDFEKFFG